MAPASKSVVVLDLLELVNELAIGLKGGNEDAAALVQSIEFVPPSESVSLRDEIKPAPLARRASSRPTTAGASRRARLP